jgi:hypothetical protein
MEFSPFQFAHPADAQRRLHHLCGIEPPMLPAGKFQLIDRSINS